MTLHRSTTPRTPGAAPATLRPDLPSRAGFDSDHPLAAGLVGVVGPALGHLGDLEALWPDRLPDVLELDGGAAGPWHLALVAALAERRGVAPPQGALLHDPLALRHAAAAPAWSDRAALGLGADALCWAGRRLPGLRGARLRVSALTPEGMALTLRSGLALLAATARREKPEHLRAAACGIDIVMPADDAAARDWGAVLTTLWQELVAERHGPGFAARPDLIQYRHGASEIASPGPDAAARLRAALLRAEADELPWPETDPSRPADAAPPLSEPDRAAALVAWRRQRDGNAVQKSLLALREAAKRGINVMGPSVACAKAGVTTGEWGAVMAGALPGAVAKPDPAPPPGVTFLLARPGLDARLPRALPSPAEARIRGIELRETGPRRLPSDIVAAVLDDRPQALLLSLPSPQSAQMAIETLAELRRAGFGAMPALGLIEFQLDAPLEKALEAAGLPLKRARSFANGDFLQEIVNLVT